MNALACRSLAFGYPGRSIASGLNAVLIPGELTCLIGPNGAGKSTLLRTLAGMQRPQAGSVHLNGTDMHRLSPRERAKLLAVVLTERVDAGNLSAATVVGLGRFPHTNWRGQLTDHDRQCVETALTRVGAAQFAARPLAELSDGERQKIMIANPSLTLTGTLGFPKIGAVAIKARILLSGHRNAPSKAFNSAVVMLIITFC